MPWTIQVPVGCAVVGGGEGVVSVAHEGLVGGGGWLPVVWGEDVTRDLVPEASYGGHTADPFPPFLRLSVFGGGAGRGMGHVWLVVAAAALGVHPPRLGVSDKVSPSVDGGHPASVSCGGRALAVRGGGRGALVPVNMEEGVKEEVSNPLPQGGCLDEGGRLMRWVVPEIQRRSTSCSPRPRRCCCTAAGLFRV